MITGFFLYSLPPRPAIVEQVSTPATVQPKKVLVAKGCSEVKRWYAWTRCGKSTCCKLYIACSNGTIVTQAVNASNCG